MAVTEECFSCGSVTSNGVWIPEGEFICRACLDKSALEPAHDALEVHNDPETDAPAKVAVVSTISAMLAVREQSSGPDETERIVVRDVSQDGTGPWKVYVAGYGVATFPSKACVEQPHEYAEEVARVIRMGVSALLSDRPCSTNHPTQTDEIEQEIRAIYDGWGESDDTVDDLVKRLAYLVRAAEARGIEKGLAQRCPEIRRQCIERAEARGRTKMREAAAMECKATGFVWSGTTVAEVLYHRILALP